MIPSQRLIDLRRRQVDRLQRRVEQLEDENDTLRKANAALLNIVYRAGVNLLLHGERKPGVKT